MKGTRTRSGPVSVSEGRWTVDCLYVVRVVTGSFRIGGCTVVLELVVDPFAEKSLVSV